MARLFSFVLAVFSVSAFGQGPLPTAPHIYVEGEAAIAVPPDQMKISIYYGARDWSVEKAKTQVDDSARGFLATCRELQIPEQDIASAMLAVNPAFDYDEGRSKPAGTDVNRSITVTLRDLSKYSHFIAAVTASKVTGISNTTMLVSQEKELLARAQLEALADARTRAERLASAAGSKLGKVYSISEFNMRVEEEISLSPQRYVSQARASRPAMVSGLSSGIASEPFLPGMVQATARVFVVYLLEK